MYSRTFCALPKRNARCGTAIEYRLPNTNSVRSFVCRISVTSENG